jgi:uncharacterized protein (DUF1499 family)
MVLKLLMLLAIPATILLFPGSSASSFGGPPIREKKLAPCPASPNCVSSISTEGSRSIAPISFTGPLQEAMMTLEEILKKMPRTTLVVTGSGYLRAECRTLLGFVDDVEFLADEPQQVIHVRSAARVGYWDLGVNRRRIEHIRTEFDHRRLNH